MQLWGTSLLQTAPGRLLFDPPAFKPEKLTVIYLNGAIPLEPLPLAARRYTLTHSDLTGHLLLSVGRHYNQGQLSGTAAELARGSPTSHPCKLGPQPHHTPPLLSC